VLLAKKHYSATLHDDTHLTKGISFVRRSGAVITDVAYRRFIGVMQKHERGPRMVDAIKQEYNCLRIQITPGPGMNHNYMVVRTTVMGVTDDYVNVLMGSDRVATRILKSDYDRNTMVYHKKYYVTLLDKCLDTVLGALKVTDASFIKASAIGYHRH
jgi:hypothetical protein